VCAPFASIWRVTCFPIHALLADALASVHVCLCLSGGKQLQLLSRQMLISLYECSTKLPAACQAAHQGALLRLHKSLTQQQSSK
jgi:hypothetical protein